MEKQSTLAYARPGDMAKHLGVCKTTLWRWSKRSDFPKPARLGPKITLYDIAEVERWIKSNWGGLE